MSDNYFLTGKARNGQGAPVYKSDERHELISWSKVPKTYNCELIPKVEFYSKKGINYWNENHYIFLCVKLYVVPLPFGDQKTTTAPWCFQTKQSNEQTKSDYCSNSNGKHLKSWHIYFTLHIWLCVTFQHLQKRTNNLVMKLYEFRYYSTSTRLWWSLLILLSS